MNEESMATQLSNIVPEYCTKLNIICLLVERVSFKTLRLSSRLNQKEAINVISSTKKCSTANEEFGKWLFYRGHTSRYLALDTKRENHRINEVSLRCD